MSNYILTADGHLYHCDPTGDELYHYGVKGMRWGVRKQLDLISNRQMRRNARTARVLAKRDALTKESGEGIGAYLNVRMAGNRASRRSITADRVHNANERANGWEQMASMAEVKGQNKKAGKYMNRAMAETSKAAKLEMQSIMADKTIKIVAKCGNMTVKAAKTIANKGKEAIDRYIEKHAKTKEM